MRIVRCEPVSLLLAPSTSHWLPLEGLPLTETSEAPFSPLFVLKKNNDILLPVGLEGREPPSLGPVARTAFYPFKCRTVLVDRRNLASRSRFESLPIRPQTGLASRFTGPWATPAEGTILLGYTICHIPILEDARRDD